MATLGCSEMMNFLEQQMFLYSGHLASWALLIKSAKTFVVPSGIISNPNDLPSGHLRGSTQL